VYDNASATFIGRMPCMLLQSGLSDKDGSDRRFTGSVTGATSFGDLVIAMVNFDVALKHKAAESGEEDGEKVEIVEEIKTDSRLVMYSLGDIFADIYPSIKKACPSSHHRHAHAKKMFISAPHESRSQPGFFDDFEIIPTGLESLMVPDNARSNINSRTGGRPGLSRRGSNATNHSGSRAPRSRMGSKRGVRGSSQASMRSTKSGTQSTKLPPPPAVVVVEDGPFKDPTRYIFAQLQERENTRDMREQRSHARKLEIRQQLEEEGETRATPLSARW
jgi:hypothetical protein